MEDNGRPEFLRSFIYVNETVRRGFNEAQCKRIIEVRPRGNKNVTPVQLERALRFIHDGFEWDPKMFGHNRFLFTFPNYQEVLTASQRGEIHSGSFSFEVVPWSVQDGDLNLGYLSTFLCLKNLPIHCRNPEIVGVVLAGFGLLDRILPATLAGADQGRFLVSVFTERFHDIPRVVEVFCGNILYLVEVEIVMYVRGCGAGGLEETERIEGQSVAVRSELWYLSNPFRSDLIYFYEFIDLDRS